MKQLKIVLAFSLFLGAGLNLASAQEETPVVIDTYTVEFYTDELDAHFYDAFVNYINNENALAANQIRSAAAYVQIEANTAKEKDKKALEKAHQELVNLATGLEAGKIESSQRLKHVFSKTHLALSRHHYLNAMDLEAKKDVDKAGLEMKNAGKHLEHAARWSGDELAKGSESAWKATKETGSAIGRGTKVAAEDVNKGIKAIGAEIKKLGKKIFSRKKEIYDIYWLEEIDLN